MFAWVRQIVDRFLSYERCLHKLSLSCCIGIYIAFSPFVGLHTAMVFLFAWLFALNFAVILTVSMTVNNPWTMVPVYGAGHMFGDWILSLWDKNHYDWNPSWIANMNDWAQHKIGMSGFSFWAFMVGGNILGIGLGFVSYPMIKQFFATMKERGVKRVRATVVKSKQVARNIAIKAKPVLKAITKRVRRKGL